VTIVVHYFTESIDKACNAKVFILITFYFLFLKYDIYYIYKKLRFLYILILFVFPVCTLNVHRRCVKNVANNCGINPREMADTLRSCGLNVSKNVVRFKQFHIIAELFIVHL